MSSSTTAAPAASSRTRHHTTSSSATATASVRGEYIETETGNKISRRASILGPKHIILAGKCVIQADVVIHGDLVRPPPPPSSSSSSSTTTTTTTTEAAATKTTTTTTTDSSQPKSGTSIQLGRYVFLSQGCVLHPPQRSGQYYPIRISDSVFIGSGTLVQAAEIRSNVHIGANCVIGNLCIIKENVKVLDGTVLPANSVWASGCVVAGRPGRVVGEIGEGWGVALGGAGGSNNSSSGNGGSGGGGEGGKGGGGIITEGVGVRARERWAGVGNAKR